MRTTLTFAALLSFALLLGCDDATPSARPVTNTPAPSITPGPSVTPRPMPTVTDRDGKTDAANTGLNKRDRDPDAKTPIDQNENQADVSTSADIRKRVDAREGLSLNALNVKIITADGKVTLRGPVASAEEKDFIDGIARDVAGKDNVDNQIDVEVAEK